VGGRLADRIVVEALAPAHQMAHGQRVELVALEPALVERDPDRLKELVLILLDNAIKYTPPGGQIVLNLCRHDGTAEVSVRDTGIGIESDDLLRVFERFYRADPARARSRRHGPGAFDRPVDHRGSWWGNLARQRAR
jgi:two-component system OmpR family sensor kinase